jgi:hypothetical protein
LCFIFIAQRQVQHQVEAVVNAEFGEFVQCGFGQSKRHDVQLFRSIENVTRDDQARRKAVRK